MDKFINWVVKPVAFGLAAFGVTYGIKQFNNSQPGSLSGTMRSSFIESFVDSCLKKQNEDPINKGISPEVISQYCSCTAKGTAELVSTNEW